MKKVRQLFDINVIGHYAVTRAFIPLLIKADRGTILFTSSIASIVYMPYNEAYGASKAAINALADTLRVELEVEDAAATDTRLGFVERGEAEAARRLARPYFVQMKGRLRVSGRAGGAPIAGTGAWFFETYR